MLDLAGAAGGEGEEEEEEEEEEEGAGAGAGEEECVAFFMSPFLAEGAEALEVESMASRASAPLDLFAAAAAEEESPWAAAVFFFFKFRGFRESVFLSDENEKGASKRTNEKALTISWKPRRRRQKDPPSQSFLTESHAADQQGRNDHALDHFESFPVSVVKKKRRGGRPALNFLET